MRTSASTGRSSARRSAESAHPVSDDDGGPVQGVVAGDGVVDIRLEIELLQRRRLRPEVCAQVERVALPAALGEEAQVSLHSHEPVSSPWR